MMFRQTDICCFCLSDSSKPFYRLDDFGLEDDLNYHEKLSQSLSRLAYDVAVDYIICCKCSEAINSIYEFQDKCLTNLKSFRKILQITDNAENEILMATEEAKTPNKLNIMEHILEKTSESNKEVLTKKNSQTLLDETTNTVYIIEEEEGNFTTDEIYKIEEIEMDVAFSSVNQKKLNDALNKSTTSADNQTTPAKTLKSINPKRTINILKKPNNHFGTTEKRKTLNNCNVCNRNFSTYTQLKNHVLIHTAKNIEKDKITIKTEEQHCCQTCNKTFDSILELNKHELEHKVVSENLEQRIKNRPHICNVCDLIFETRDALNKHIIVHTAKNKFECLDCKKIIVGEDYNEHLYHHTGKKPYECSICKEGFLEKSKLLQHEFAHNSSLDNENLLERIEVVKKSEGNKFNCPVCYKVFFTPMALKKHSLNHLEEKRHKCDICGKDFYHKRYLENHRMTHSDEKNFICDLCGRQFKHKDTFRKHKYFHEHEREYECEICQKGFHLPSALEKHKIIHTDLKPFSCTVCFKQFRYQIGLKTHMRIHTNERPYACDECDKTFRVSSALKKHKFTHSGIKPHVCNLCGKGFIQKNNLNEHILCHSVDKPYSCNICGKGYIKKDNLMQHYNIHTGDKPYECDICNVKFHRRKALAKHKLCHTME